MFDSLIAWLRRPVAWGAVLLSYVGIFLMLCVVYVNRVELVLGLRHEATQRQEAIVQSGREAIFSACKYDNQRSQELRDILQRSVAAQERLYKRGVISKDVYERGARILQNDISEISTRDCNAAARVLTANSKESK